MAVAVIALGSPAPVKCASTIGTSSNTGFKQCGSGQVTINPGSSNGFTTVNFNPSFKTLPTVKVWGAGGTSVESIETQYDFLDFVSVTTAITTTKTVFAVDTVALAVPFGVINIPTQGEFQADITANTGTGIPTVWVEGFDCNVDQLSIGTSAWEALGSVVKTPKISTAGTGYSIGARASLNQTLLGDIVGCIGSNSTEYMLLRVVGTNTVGTRTVTVTKLTLSIYYNMPPAILTRTGTFTTSSFQVYAVGVPGTYGFEWEATV